MKFFTYTPLLISLASAAILPSLPQKSVAPREEKVDYNGYRVYRVALDNAPVTLEEQLKSFHTIHMHGSIEVAIPPSEIQSFESLTLDVELINEDLGRDIAAEASSISSYSPPLQKKEALPDLSWFDTYHPYDDHIQYWTDLQAAFPENSQLFDVGPSYEGRQIFGLQLWGDSVGNVSKPIIYWHATVHAREWISTAVRSP